MKRHGAKDLAAASWESGFTLIELLIVIAILGILVGLALPGYAEYRIRGFNANASADLRNLVTAEEAAILDQGEYLGCVNELCNDPTLPGMQVSNFVQINCRAREAGVQYRCSTKHSKGTVTYLYDSETATFWEE